MRIAVVSYDELNDKKRSDEVCKDLVSFLDNASEDLLMKLGSEFKNALSEIKESAEAEIIFVDTSEMKKRQLIIGKLAEMAPEILVSYSGAGFEWTTLTDGFGYNRLSCMQVHFVSHADETALAIARDKVLGINVFLAYE